MKITYIFRAPTNERSIERVFSPIMSRIREMGYNPEVVYAITTKCWLWAVVKNMIRFSRLSHHSICHITGDIQYVGCFMNPNNTILTIHDLVSLHNDKTPWWFKKIVYWLWYYVPLKRLKYITCISENTKQDLIVNFPWLRDKINIIPNPVGHEFSSMPLPKIDKLPIILHVGTRTNKNLLRVIEAMKGVNAILRIIGKLDIEQKKALETSGIRYSNAYNLNDQEILDEYRLSTIVSFPSLFEGFGMPIIEAHAVGRPVVTSNREPMKSVAGGAAVIVDPESVESIRDGFVKLLSDDNLQQMCVTLGYENVKRYTSSSIAKDYERLYILMINKR